MLNKYLQLYRRAVGNKDNCCFSLYDRENFYRQWCFVFPYRKIFNAAFCSDALLSMASPADYRKPIRKKSF